MKPASHDWLKFGIDEIEKIVDGGGLEDHELTFALERHGQLIATSIKWLVDKFFHPSAIVREGAVYGADSALTATTNLILEGLFALARDPSPGVRAAVLETACMTAALMTEEK